MKIPPLTLLVLLAVVVGVAWGCVAPESAVSLKLLSDDFIRTIQGFVAPIIFLTVTLGLAGMANLRAAGRVGFKALLYFEAMTTVALVLGLAVAWVGQPGGHFHAGGLDVTSVDVSTYRKGAEHFSWGNFLRHNVTLQVLAAAVLAGVVLGRWRDRGPIIGWLELVSRWVFQALHWVMWLAPLGALGGIGYTVGKFGLSSLLPLAKLMATVYVTMALFVFGALGLVLRWCGIGIWAFIGAFRDELLVVLSTSSSESALPQLMVKLESFGCPRSVVGLVVPAGYSFNLDGTTLYLSMAVMFLAQVYHVSLTATQVLALLGVLALTSKGAAGVTGSGFITLASTLMALKVIPLEGLALLVGVDRFMSEARSITNFLGNGVAALAVARWEGAELHLPAPVDPAPDPRVAGRGPG